MHTTFLQSDCKRPAQQPVVKAWRRTAECSQTFTHGLSSQRRCRRPAVSGLLRLWMQGRPLRAGAVRKDDGRCGLRMALTPRFHLTDVVIGAINE